MIPSVVSRPCWFGKWTFLPNMYIWDVFCGYKLFFRFCLSYWCALYNIVLYWNLLYRHSTVHWFEFLVNWTNHDLVHWLIYASSGFNKLTHWGRVTHICFGKLTIIGSDNGLSPGRRQAIIWTIAGILLIGPLGTNFSEILIGIQIFSFKKMHLKMSSAKWRPFCLGLSEFRSQSMWRNRYRLTAILFVEILLVSGYLFLTHWDRDKMAAVSQTTLSNAFSLMKMS